MYRKMSILITLLALVSMILASCAPAAVATEAPAAAAPAKEPVTITVATIAGFYTDWAEQVAKEYEAQSGNKVEFVKMDLPTMYEKEVLDMVGNTGAYDVITWNVSWKAEWANNGYLLALDDYVAKEDPAELALEDITPILVKTGGYWGGKTLRPAVLHLYPGYALSLRSVRGSG